jgi:alcohol dehydrogenase (cytochrome c)
MRRQPRLSLFVAAAAVILIACLAAFIVDGSALRVRAVIVFYKATGRLDDIGWSDLLWLMRSGKGGSLADLADTENPYEAITSPLRTKSDLEAGKRLFLEQCSSCHGDVGNGGAGGPSLRDRVFRRGNSDWALYQTIRLGVPGTAMVGRLLPRDDVWRLVGYLSDAVIGRATEAEANGPARAAVEAVTATELRDAENDPAEWLTYSGSYSGQRHSRLGRINRGNVGQLRVAWVHQFSTDQHRVETSPIIRGSTMFVTEPPNRVDALDAASGRVLWTYSRRLLPDLHLCCNTVNRGIALLGDKVFVGTLDAHLVALDANTGQVVWDVAVAEPSSGYSITGAPLAVGDMIVTGVAGGEFGIRGFLDAYDAATGKQRWRFFTVPEAGALGSETWDGDSLRRGGSPTWLTGSFDPELRIIYWGVGNPSPVLYGGGRGGDNLYSDSVVALDADSGKLRWYFQFTPHDLHDWDSTEIPVLVDTVVNNAMQKLLAFANRNAFYYLLDRSTGKFLLGTPFVKQTWADGLDKNGRPHVRPESIPNRQGAIVFPGANGGTNWWSPSYDPELQLLYVPTIDRGGIFFASPDRLVDALGETLASVVTGEPGEEVIGAVKALELTTGRVRWQYVPAPGKSPAVGMGGVMSTAGRLVFGGELETFFALDAETGKELWRFDAGGLIVAPPVSYELAGRQYVAIAAGRNIMAFALPEPESQATAPTTSH